MLTLSVCMKLCFVVTWPWYKPQSNISFCSLLTWVIKRCYSCIQLFPPSYTNKGKFLREFCKHGHGFAFMKTLIQCLSLVVAFKELDMSIRNIKDAFQEYWKAGSYSQQLYPKWYRMQNKIKFKIIWSMPPDDHLA